MSWPGSRWRRSPAGLPTGPPQHDPYGPDDAGDLLLLYTDGLADALNLASRSSGRRRLEVAIESRPDASASALKDGLLSEVQRFAAGAPQADDLTLVLLLRED